MGWDGKIKESCLREKQDVEIPAKDGKWRLYYQSWLASRNAQPWNRVHYGLDPRFGL